MIFGQTEVLVWFFASDSFGCFWVRDGGFIDVVILEDFTTFPQCICFRVLVVSCFLFLEHWWFRGS